MTEKEILQQALVDYQHALDSGWQKIIDEWELGYGQNKKYPHVYPYRGGLCYYLEHVQGFDHFELDYIIPVYFEVCKLSPTVLKHAGNLSKRIEWIKRAIELIDHRAQVELHKNIGNPKFAYTDDTFNREQVKKAIWKEQ